MIGNAAARRVLLTASVREGAALRALFAGGHVAGWQSVDAANIERARFSQQMDPCDVVLLDSSLARADSDSLMWLAGPRRTPIVILSDEEPETLQVYFEKGVGHWLPRRLVLTHPLLLAAVLHQAAQLSDLQRQVRQGEQKLQDCQRQVNRLVEMLWQTVPLEARAAWFSQRHMMERLYEEVMRSQRHGAPLTVVLGELMDGPRQPIAAVATDDLGGWTAQQVGKHKRRCDVAGQYGPHGFMLLLPHTSDRGAQDCCRRLRPLLENPEELPVGAAAPLQVSFGLATFGPGSTTVKSLLGRAEERLEQARQAASAQAPRFPTADRNTP
jgi:diguanylate cyclase (GGDEF)-like protein